MSAFLYLAPCAPLRLDFNQQHQLIELSWLTEFSQSLKPLNGLWKKNLDDYFTQKPYTFNYPVSTAGTPFQQRVWQAIQTIPYGHVASYKDIAKLIDSHPRAVGQACGKNPLPIIVPCHRVVATNGLGGFSLGRREQNLAIKRWLLQHEGATW